MNHSAVIESIIHTKRQERIVTFSFEDESIQGEAQYLFNGENFNISAGFNTYSVDGLVRESPTRTRPEVRRNRDITHRAGYIYSNIKLPADVIWTFGVSIDNYDEEDLEIKNFNPKLGVQWDVTDWLRLRLAAFETIKPAAPARRATQPTQVAGFNQLFDDVDGTESWSYGAEIDARLAQDLSVGMEIFKRNLKDPIFNFTRNVRRREDREEMLLRAYGYWTLDPSWAVSTELQFADYDGNPDRQAGPTPNEVKTWAIPVSIRYFHPAGLFGAVAATFVHQDVDTVFASNSRSEFIVVDVALGYRFPRRRGSISFEASNLFNRQFNFAWGSYRPNPREVPTVSPFIPERTVIARLTLSF